MRIKTKYLGEIEIEEAQIIQFQTGMPGFVDETQFVLLDLAENTMFQVLQSVTSAHTAFIIANPYQMYQDYTFELDDNLLESLSIQEKKDVAVFSIVTLKKPFSSSTMNLKAPIIINPNKKQGKQYILSIDDYSTRAPIAEKSSSKVKGE